MAAPLIWDFKINGADEARRQIQDVGMATRGAGDDSVEYAKNLRDQARDANLVIRVDEYRSRILMAQHPILRETMQGASMLSSITRSAVAVQNMWNTAMLLTQGTTSDMIQNQDELARVQSEYNDLVSRGLGDSVKAQELKEQANVLNARIKESADAAAASQLNLAFAFVTGGAQIAASIVQMIPRLIAMATTSVASGAVYTGALASMSTATEGFSLVSKLAFLTNPWFLLAAAIAVVAVLIVTHWDDVVSFFNTYLLPAFQTVGEVFSSVGKFIADNWQILATVLTGGIAGLVIYIINHWQEISNGLTIIWQGMQKGFVALWNGFATIANSGIGAITKGIEFFVNAAVDALNVLISAYNAAVSIVGGKGISLIGHIALAPPQIPLITAAAGFNGIVSSPTMFVAGEAGQSERVSIGSVGAGSGGGGATINIYNTIQGSVVTERELEDKILRALDLRLQDRGF